MCYFTKLEHIAYYKANDTTQSNFRRKHSTYAHRTSHAHAHPRTHTPTHARTRTRARARTHAHTHTHTHTHTPSIAFRHLPPNSARFSYATERALLISAQLYTDTISAVPKVSVLIRLWKQPSALART